MRFPSVAGITDAFGAATRRFPVPVLIAVISTICCITYVEIQKDYDHDSINWLLKCTMVGQVGLALTIALTSFAETRIWTGRRKWALIGGGILLLIGYYLTIDLNAFDVAEISRHVGLLGVVHLMVAFCPYLNKFAVADFWTFNARILGNLLTGAFYSAILWMGLAGAVLGVNELFEMNIRETIYIDLFLALAGIFNTIWFLYHFPDKYEFSEENEPLFQILCKFILIPISILYFLILYAYTGKILLLWSLPKGWVASLVIGFAAFGIFTWLLNFILARRLGERSYTLFARWFWPVLLPMIVLLFAAVGRRIGDYGITMERYIVAYAGIWLLTCALYFIISKKDNIKFVPVSLAGFIIVALYGPLNMFKISDRSQTAILQTLLEKNNLWQNDRVKRSSDIVHLEDYPRIYDVMAYLTKRKDVQKHKPEWLAPVPDSLLTDSWNNAAVILKWMNVDNRAHPDAGMDEEYSISGQDNYDLDIPSGYTALFEIDLHSRNPVERKGRYFTLDTGGVMLSLRKFDTGGKRTLSDVYHVSNLLKQWTAGEKYLQLEPNTIYALSGKNNDILLLVERADIVVENKLPHLRNLKGQIFLKTK